jgi:hypothetical protein
MYCLNFIKETNQKFKMTFKDLDAQKRTFLKNATFDHLLCMKCYQNNFSKYLLIFLIKIGSVKNLVRSVITLMFIKRFKTLNISKFL